MSFTILFFVNKYEASIGEGMTASKSFTPIKK
jgi:hypothetical protein